MTEIVFHVPRVFGGPDCWGCVRQKICGLLYGDNWNSLSCSHKELPPIPRKSYTKMMNTKLTIMFDGRVDHRNQLRLYEILRKAWKEIPGFTYEITHSYRDKKFHREYA